MKCNMLSFWDRISGKQKKMDWEKIQCLILKLAKEQKYCKRYKEFWNNADEAFVLLKAPDGNIIDANPAACSLYGYPRDVIVTKTIFDLSAEPECTRQTYDSRAKDVPFRWHKNADGTRFMISCSLSYFQDNGDGEIAALIVRQRKERHDDDE